jgi:hypothetical protein
MKIYLSKYRYHWLSPYTILEKVCFWEKDKDVFYNLNDEPNHKYEKVVDFLTTISGFIQKVLDIIHPKIDYVKIDYWDTWNMDGTLGKIILPMLKQLRDTKHGSQIVDLEDVPEELRCITHEEYDSQKSFDWYHEHKVEEGKCDIHARWDWVLNEMIFAFERLNDDSWEDNFRSGTIDMKREPCAWDENGKPTMYQMIRGPNDTYECNYEAIQLVHDRMNNGFRLFGKYYRGLWD